MHHVVKGKLHIFLNSVLYFQNELLKQLNNNNLKNQFIHRTSDKMPRPTRFFAVILSLH